MTLDPINHPVPPEDTIYADAGPANRSPEEKKKAHAKSFEHRQETERNELAAVLRTVEGQGFMLRLLAHCGPYRSVHMEDHAQAAVEEGRRRVGLWLIDQIQRVDPELYPNLLLAHLKRQTDLNRVEVAMATGKAPAAL